jgi:hypothetical protein
MMMQVMRTIEVLIALHFFLIKSLEYQSLSPRMSGVIKCRNVVKVKFDGVAPKVPQVAEDDELKSMEAETSTFPAMESLISNNELFGKPPRTKQLLSMQILVDQYNMNFSTAECQFLFIIEAEWFNAWLRCVVTNDTSLYPGPINNWSIIDKNDSHKDLSSAINRSTSIDRSTTGKQVPGIIPLAHYNDSSCSPLQPVIRPARRASRGLSFDGEDCDFAEELELFQRKMEQHHRSPLKSSVADGEGSKGGSNVVQKEEEEKIIEESTYEYNTCQFRLRPGLREGKDFYLLPLEAWQALHSWYGGGPPLPRYLYNHARYGPDAPCLHCALLLYPPHQLPEFVVGREVDAEVEEEQGDSGQGEEEEEEEEGSGSELVDYYPIDPPCFTDALPAALPPEEQLMLNPAVTGVPQASLASLHYSISTTSFSSMADLTSVARGTKVLTVAGGRAGGFGGSGGSSGSSSSGSGSGGLESTSDEGHIATKAALDSSHSGKPAAAAIGKVGDAHCNLARCHVCKTPTSQRCSKCSSIFYCKKECQRLHWRYHKLLCSKLSRVAADRLVLTNDVDPVLSVANVKHDRGGNVGLLNLGNSCYMNSSLQCLSHIKPLTLGFLSRSLMNDLNRDSVFGSGGQLAEQYAKLLDDLWFDPTRRAISPHQLKTTLGRINYEYAGMMQQDAHELIELMLDKLHEDLNRVLKKPYTEKVEGDGSEEERVSAEAWRVHGLREDSAVRDLMGSLMRYQLTCTQCGKVSVSYEYHTTMQVHLIFLVKYVRFFKNDFLLCVCCPCMVFSGRNPSEK